jgi:uncharacterized membrane protein
VDEILVHHILRWAITYLPSIATRRMKVKELNLLWDTSARSRQTDQRAYP